MEEDGSKRRNKEKEREEMEEDSSKGRNKEKER